MQLQSNSYQPESINELLSLAKNSGYSPLTTLGGVSVWTLVFRVDSAIKFVLDIIEMWDYLDENLPLTHITEILRGIEIEELQHGTLIFFPKISITH